MTPEIYRELKNSGNGKYSIERVFHHLVKEGFNVPFRDLADLTPVVVKHIYFRSSEEDEHKSLLPPAIRHRQECEAKGMTEEEIQASWQQKLDGNPTLRQMHSIM